MHYLYVKAKTGYDLSAPSRPGGAVRFLPLILLFVGLFLLASAAGPIFFYQFLLSPHFKTELVKPVNNDFLAVSSQSNKVLAEDTQEPTLDMSQVSNWFPTAPRLLPRPSKITHYTLSLPKLKIKEAVVQIGGEDLKKSLVQYQGTAFPGQFGNAVIFGHSTLPQFFNPQNYLSIFSTLPSLKKKDLILVDFDGVSYRYVVEEMFEVKPDDISVLEQRFDDAYLTLVTCVPPGTYLRRLVVKARLTLP